MSKIITIPGLIDIHVHLREPGATQKEDFETGSKAAIAGGYTAILDMPNNPIPTVTPQALDQKIALAQGRIYTDLGFHFGATAANSKFYNKVQDKVFGLKVYMNHTTGDLLMEERLALENVFKNWPHGRPILVHAEGGTLRKAIELARKYHQQIHVCHVSLKQEIELIKQAKKEGLNISCEVTCHHLFLTEDDAKKLGPYGMMRPPLSKEEDRDALWEAVMDGTLDIIASDHAPHTKGEKENPEKVVNGVPGLETNLPLLLTLVNKGKISLEKVIELTSKNPRRIFKIPNQNSEVEIDLEEKYTISSKNLYTKCGWTPFEGMEVRGKVKRVKIRGKFVFKKDLVLGPHGQVIYPKVDS